MVKSSNTKPDFAILPPRALVEFKAIFKEEFGVELSDEEGAQKALVVLNLFKIFSKPKIKAVDIKEPKRGK